MNNFNGGKTAVFLFPLVLMPQVRKRKLYGIVVYVVGLKHEKAPPVHFYGVLALIVCLMYLAFRLYHLARLLALKIFAVSYGFFIAENSTGALLRLILKAPSVYPLVWRLLADYCKLVCPCCHITPRFLRPRCPFRTRAALYCTPATKQAAFSACRMTA